MSDSTDIMAGEKVTKQKQSRFTRILVSLKTFATWSEVLRMAGAAAVVASISVFLMQGWTEVNDIQRYLKLLAQTGLFALGGYLLSTLLKESKGARMFFALALGSIPANFAVLGALIWSIMPLDNPIGSFPRELLWSLQDSSGLVLTLIGALVAMILVAFLGFSIWARKHAFKLSAAYLLLNCLVLLPFRGSLITVFLSVVALASAWFMARKIFPSTSPSRTSGERFATVLLSVPAVLIAARSLYLYQIDALALAVLGLIGYVVCRNSYKLVVSGSTMGSVIALSSLVFASIVAGSLVEMFDPHLSSHSAAILFAALCCCYLFDFNIWCKLTTASHIANILTTVGIILASLAISLSGDALFGLLSAILFNLFVVFTGSKNQYRSVILLGLAGVVINIAVRIGELVDILFVGNWFTLAALGCLAIVVASVIERYGVVIKYQTRKLLFGAS
jgi:hypothetical protein